MPKLCVMPGDGVGLEVIPIAVQMLQKVMPDLETENHSAGWRTFVEEGVSVPDRTLDALFDCGVGLFGAVSSPTRKVEGYRSAILTMRKALDLFANLRPVRSWPNVSPRDDVDLVVVRENTEGLYISREHMEDGDTAVAQRVVTRGACERIGKIAVDLAAERTRKLTIVHKANVLPLTDGLFRDVVRDIAEASPMNIEECLVDVAALRMVAEPQNFDVVVAPNLYGDILSDAAAHWCGGLGMAPSLNLGDNIFLAEPVHGSAPDIQGKGLANPIAAVLSAALLARYAYVRPEAADRMESAVTKVLSQDKRPSKTRAIAEQLLSALES